MAYCSECGYSVGNLKSNGAVKGDAFLIAAVRDEVSAYARTIISAEALIQRAVISGNRSCSLRPFLYGRGGAQARRSSAFTRDSCAANFSIFSLRCN